MTSMRLSVLTSCPVPWAVAAVTAPSKASIGPGSQEHTRGLGEYRVGRCHATKEKVDTFGGVENLSRAAQKGEISTGGFCEEL